MDKFVVRQPRPPKSEDSKPSTSKNYKQATIESLKGVVVIEDILRVKSVLKLDGQSAENLVSALKELKQKIPSREVMKSTKIGHTVNKLTKHSNDDVSKLAKRIVVTWKRHFEDKMDRPQIEVKCDRKTESLRNAGKKHLTAALGVTEDNRLPECIERETFFAHGRLVNNSYRRSMRALVFTLKHQVEVRNKVLDRSMDVKDFVAAYRKQLT